MKVTVQAIQLFNTRDKWNLEDSVNEMTGWLANELQDNVVQRNYPGFYDGLKQTYASINALPNNDGGIYEIEIADNVYDVIKGFGVHDVAWNVSARNLQRTTATLEAWHVIIDTVKRHVDNMVVKGRVVKA